MKKLYLIVGYTTFYKFDYGMWDYEFEYADSANQDDLIDLEGIRFDLVASIVENNIDIIKIDFGENVDPDNFLYDQEDGFILPIVDGIKEEDLSGLVEEYGINSFIKNFCED